MHQEGKRRGEKKKEEKKKGQLNVADPHFFGQKK
jgi:hypothetical protein